MKRSILLLAFIAMFSVIGAVGQVSIPPSSPNSKVWQNVGDAVIMIDYNRPSVKNRTVWGELVPLDKVWRTGANEATVFEVSGDVTINGTPLAKGKYSLHTIPGKDEWTIIFNKVWDQWGSFQYDEKQDALRVTSKPVAGDFKETMAIEIDNVTANSADVVIAWEKLRVPFTVNVGDVDKRLLDGARSQMVSNGIIAARYVIDSKMTDRYADAMKWLDSSLMVSESYNGHFQKARLLNAMGKKAEAMAAAEKAIAFGKSQTPAANVGGAETLLKQLKEGK